jgi:hypothetical protein
MDRRGLGVLVVMVVAAGALPAGPPPAWAQAPAGEIVAFSAGPGGVAWQPLILFDHGVLTIASPGGTVTSEEFGPGADLRVDPATPLPDGLYTWEVRLSRPSAVSPDLWARARSARETGTDPAAAAALRAALNRTTRVQSGAFRILDSALVPSDRRERWKAPASRSHRPSRTPFAPVTLAVLEGEPPVLPVDDVIADDLIVQGRACLGSQCANGETFGVPPVKIKGNLPWLQFEDTESGAYAHHDWTLRAGDPYFSEEFAIWDETTGTGPFKILSLSDSGAPTNSLVVAASGNIGVGTATPDQDLEIVRAVAPSLRLNQSGGASPAQAWEVSGDDASLSVADLTHGSQPFWIVAGAPSQSLVVAGNGRVGIGTYAPGGNLHIGGTATQDLFSGIGPDLVAGPAFNFGYAGSSFGRSAGFFNVRPDASAVAPNPSLRFATANVQRMIIDNEGFLGLGTSAFNPAHPIHVQATGARLDAAGVWQNGSSRDLKTDVQALGIDEARAALAALSPVKYAARADPAERHLGFIAEDVPDLVASRDRRSLSPMDIVAVLTRMVQEQQATIAELARKVATLEQAAAR